MTAINPLSGVSVPLQGTLSGEAFAARNAAAPVALPPTAGVPASVQSGIPGPPPDALVRLAIAQGGLAPLYADLAAASVRSDLPQTVQDAVKGLLSAGLDSAALDAGSVETAFSKSGLFLEAMLARGEAADGDLKLSLLTLRSALRHLVPDGSKLQAPVPQSPPPHRSSLLLGEPPGLPSIAGLDGEAVNVKLLSETEAALARTTLLQLASLPEDGASPANTRLVLEFPMATPQGHAVIQFQVEPDTQQRNASGEAQAPSWRINFAIDLEPLGPVRASVRQIDGRTHVNLYAERDTTARALRDGLPALQTQLAEAALDPGDLNCRNGKPPREPTKPGLFVDRAS